MTLYPEQDLFSEILPGLWQGGTHDFDTLEFPKQYPIWNQKILIPVGEINAEKNLKFILTVQRE